MLKLTLPMYYKEYPEGITLLEVGRELNGFYSQPVVEVFLTVSAPICRSFAQRRHC